MTTGDGPPRVPPRTSMRLAKTGRDRLLALIRVRPPATCALSQHLLPVHATRLAVVAAQGAIDAEQGSRANRAPGKRVPACQVCMFSLSLSSCRSMSLSFLVTTSVSVRLQWLSKMGCAHLTAARGLQKPGHFDARICPSELIR